MKWRFVDRILSWTPNERITGIKAVSFEEYSLKDAFGGEAFLPETLLLESFMQLGNWLILLSSDFNEMGMVVRISEVRFHEPLLPAQQVRMEVRLSRRREDGFELSGEGRVNGKSIITGLGCLAVPLPTKECVDPADLRVVFSEIYQPA
jgi:3-hydroxymyristoyl/3-hydroxydecanoyl-(acyl carrier protein) dehydratase